MAAGAGKWLLAIKFLIQIGPNPPPSPTRVLGLELVLGRLVLKNGLWLLSFLCKLDQIHFKRLQGFSGLNWHFGGWCWKMASGCIQPPGFSPQRGSPTEKPGGCINFRQIFGKGIQPPGFSPQRGSPTEKPGGCINFRQIFGKGIQPPGFSPQRGSPTEKPGGCITFPQIFGKGIQPPGFSHLA